MSILNRQPTLFEFNRGSCPIGSRSEAEHSGRLLERSAPTHSPIPESTFDFSIFRGQLTPPRDAHSVSWADPPSSEKTYVGEERCESVWSNDSEDTLTDESVDELIHRGGLSPDEAFATPTLEDCQSFGVPFMTPPRQQIPREAPAPPMPSFAARSGSFALPFLAPHATVPTEVGTLYPAGSSVPVTDVFGFTAAPTRRGSRSRRPPPLVDPEEARRLQHQHSVAAAIAHPTVYDEGAGPDDMEEDPTVVEVPDDEDTWLQSVPAPDLAPIERIHEYETVEEGLKAAIPEAARVLTRPRFNFYKSHYGIVLKGDINKEMSKIRRVELARVYAKNTRQRKKEEAVEGRVSPKKNTGRAGKNKAQKNKKTNVKLLAAATLKVGPF